MPGTLRDSCLGTGLSLANADVETCNEDITEVNVEVIEVIPAGKIGSSPGEGVKIRLCVL